MQLAQFPTTTMPIAKNQRFAEAYRMLAELNTEIAALRKSIQNLRGVSYLRAQAEEGLSGPQALEQAQRLLAGEAVEDLSDVPAKIRQAEHKLAILEPAAREQSRLVEAIRGEVSAAAGAAVKVRHRKALLDILRAARLLAVASQAESRIRGELLENGYQVLDGLTPPPRFAVPLLLGDEQQSGSALWHFRQQLEELGIQ